MNDKFFWLQEAIDYHFVDVVINDFTEADIESVKKMANQFILENLMKRIEIVTTYDVIKAIEKRRKDFKDEDCMERI